MLTETLAGEPEEDYSEHLGLEGRIILILVLKR
jgi:hypothetical protein